MRYEHNFIVIGTSLLKRKTAEPINLGGLTKSAAAMLAAKHASALKAASANETGDGDIEVVGIVPAQGSKFLTNPQSDRTQINFLNKLNPASRDGKGNISPSASSALARAAARQMAGTPLEDANTSLNLDNLSSAYSSIGESNSSYTNLMAAAAARDPYYQALLASGLGGSSGNSSAASGGANTVDLLQKCK